MSNVTAGLDAFLAEIKSWSREEADAFFAQIEGDEIRQAIPPRPAGVAIASSLAYSPVFSSGSFADSTGWNHWALPTDSWMPQSLIGTALVNVSKLAIPPFLTGNIADFAASMISLPDPLSVLARLGASVQVSAMIHYNDLPSFTIEDCLLDGESCSDHLVESLDDSLKQAA